MAAIALVISRSVNKQVLVILAEPANFLAGSGKVGALKLDG